MNISEELLRRYSLGECTQEEIIAVEAWLKDTTSEDDEKYIHEFAPAKARIWAELAAELQDGNESKIHKLYKHKYSLYAAASVFIAAVGIGYYTMSGIGCNLNESFYDTNVSEDQTIKKSYPRLDCYLQPASAIKGNLGCTDGSITFKGPLKLVNQSEKSLMVNFSELNNATSVVRNILLQPEKIYYVGKLTQAHRADDILVMTSHELDNIPPHIRIMAFKDINL